MRPPTDDEYGATVAQLRVAGFTVIPPAERAAMSLEQALRESRRDEQALALGQVLADMMASRAEMFTMAPAHLLRRMLELSGGAAEALANRSPMDLRQHLLQVVVFAMAQIASLASGTPIQAIQVQRTPFMSPVTPEDDS